MATFVRTVFDGTFNPQPSSQTNRRALKLRSPSNSSPILTVNRHTILQRHLDLRGHCQRFATENGDVLPGVVADYVQSLSFCTMKIV